VTREFKPLIMVFPYRRGTRRTSAPFETPTDKHSGQSQPQGILTLHTGAWHLRDGKGEV